MDRETRLTKTDTTSSIPDNHVAPRRSALFTAHRVLTEVRERFVRTLDRRCILTNQPDTDDLDNPTEITAVITRRSSTRGIKRGLFGSSGLRRVNCDPESQKWWSDMDSS